MSILPLVVGGVFGASSVCISVGALRGGRTARSNTGSGCIRSRDACFTGGTTQPGPQFLGFSAECLLLSDVLGQGVGGTGNRTDCLNCHRDLLSQFLVYP